MTPQSLSVTSIKVVAKTGELMPLSVLIVPRLQHRFKLSQISNSTDFHIYILQGLTLGHPITGDRPFEVSLLISIDHYWKLVGDHVIRGDGPTAIQSKLGYLLSGPLHLSNHTQEITSTFHVSASPPNIEQTVEKFGPLSLPEHSQPHHGHMISSQTVILIHCSRRQWLSCQIPWRDNHAPAIKFQDL